jgi:hypothetical protein
LTQPGGVAGIREALGVPASRDSDQLDLRVHIVGEGAVEIPGAHTIDKGASGLETGIGGNPKVSPGARLHGQLVSGDNGVHGGAAGGEGPVGGPRAGIRAGIRPVSCVALPIRAAGSGGAVGTDAALSGDLLATGPQRAQA